MTCSSGARFSGDLSGRSALRRHWSLIWRVLEQVRRFPVLVEQGPWSLSIEWEVEAIEQGVVISARVVSFPVYRPFRKLLPASIPGRRSTPPPTFLKNASPRISPCTLFHHHHGTCAPPAASHRLTRSDTQTAVVTGARRNLPTATSVSGATRVTWWISLTTKTTPFAVL